MLIAYHHANIRLLESIVRFYLCTYKNCGFVAHPQVHRTVGYSNSHFMIYDPLVRTPQWTITQQSMWQSVESEGVPFGTGSKLILLSISCEEHYFCTVEKHYSCLCRVFFFFKSVTYDASFRLQFCLCRQ